MKVTLIDCTGFGTRNPEAYAADRLIFAKSTRLTMSPGLLQEIEGWDWDKKYAELEYIANTIPASHEFVDYTFLIEGVTRAFTHQLVRSRQFSYAQQTMRVLNVSEGTGWDYLTGPTIENNSKLNLIYESHMMFVADCYKELLEDGAAIEDARGVLPTNILTNIMMKGNLRNFCELIKKRSSSRTQGEYRDVLNLIKNEMLLAHPFVQMFFDRTFDRAANELDKMIREVVSDVTKRTDMIKRIDLMRIQS